MPIFKLPSPNLTEVMYSEIPQWHCYFLFQDDLIAVGSGVSLPIICGEGKHQVPGQQKCHSLGKEW